MCNLIKQTEPVISYPTGSIIKVKTIFEKPTRKMDLAKLDSSKKLTSLKTKDPFMYYSIDSVRDAAVHHRPVDVSIFNAPNIVTRKKVYHDLFAEDASNGLDGGRE